MRITALRLNQFRNLDSFELSDLGGINILVGKNAQGKTNILEAIYAAASGGSFRTSREEFLVKRGNDNSQVFIESEGEKSGEQYLQLFWALDEGRLSRVVKINAVESSRAELMKVFPAVIFSPEDIDLIRLSPQQRRRFMNLVIGRYDKEYRHDLLEYGRVLRQRNQLLLMIKQGRAPLDDLDVWNEKISEVGARIADKRYALVKALSPSVASYYRLVANGHSNEKIEIKYQPNLTAISKAEYLDLLKRFVNLDIARATTTQGIHKDDLSFVLGGTDMRYTASRGEFRSAVLALKFAEGEYLKSKLEETPVYLLDDVFSELDDDRKQALAKEIEKSQAFITTNNKTTADLFAKAHVFEVEAGRLCERSVVG